LTITIRKATLKDLEAIYPIELECFAQEAFSKQLLEYFLRSKDFLTLIASLNGEAVGFITGSVESFRGKPVGHIYTLDVKRNHRRKGVGSSLLQALECALAERGVEVCILEVRLSNVAAQNLYFKHGYKPSQTLKDYYGFGADGVRLEKSLKRVKGHLKQKYSYTTQL